MTKDDEFDPTVLWNSAVPLSQAALRFAPAELRARWAELTKMSALSEGTKAMEKVAPRSSLMDMLGACLTGMSSIMEPRGEVLRHAQGLLLEHLKKGRATGVGFEPPRRVRSVPIVIPERHWHQIVRWDSCEVLSGSLKFLDVRVLARPKPKPVILEPIPETQKIGNVPSPRIGRPSIQHHVRAAFEAMNVAGQIDPERSARSHYAFVKQWINQNTSCAADDLSDEGIRAHFSPLFKALKTDRKQ